MGDNAGNKVNNDVEINTGLNKDKSNELLFYFSQIPSANCKTILDNVSQQSTEKYSLCDKEDRVMDNLLKVFLADKTQRESKFSFPSSPTPLAPLVKSMKSGLEINLTSHSIDNLESTKVILTKHKQGSNPIAKIKTHDKVVKAIDPKLSTE